MSKCICRIEKLANGYQVEMSDPEIIKQNRAPYDKNKPSKPWRDPMVAYAFKNIEELTSFLTKALPHAVPDVDEYSTSFDKCCTEASDD